MLQARIVTDRGSFYFQGSVLTPYDLETLRDHLRAVQRESPTANVQLELALPDGTAVPEPLAHCLRQVTESGVRVSRVRAIAA